MLWGQLYAYGVSIGLPSLFYFVSTAGGIVQLCLLRVLFSMADGQPQAPGPSAYAASVAATASTMAAAATAAAAQGSPTKKFEAGGESWTWVDGKGWAK